MAACHSCLKVMTRNVDTKLQVEVVISKTALILGAGGFIGRYVCERFLAEGWRVIGMGHNALGPTGASYRGISADITLRTLSQIGETPELVIFCAGGKSVGFASQHPQSDFELTVGALQNTLEFLRTHAPYANLTFCSTAAVYGEGTTATLAENSAPHPPSMYAMHRYLCELLCRSYGENFGIRSLIIRFFSIYGPGLRKQLLWDACTQMQAGENMFRGSGLELRDWLHVTDAARLIFQMADRAHRTAPVLNGGTGIATSISQVLTQLFQVAGSNQIPLFSGVQSPGQPLRMVADTRQLHAWGFQPQVEWKRGLVEYVKWFEAEFKNTRATKLTRKAG